MKLKDDGTYDAQTSPKIAVIGFGEAGSAYEGWNKRASSL